MVIVIAIVINIVIGQPSSCQQTSSTSVDYCAHRHGTGDRELGCVRACPRWEEARDEKGNAKGGGGRRWGKRREIQYTTTPA